MSKFLLLFCFMISVIIGLQNSLGSICLIAGLLVLYRAMPRSQRTAAQLA